MATLRICAVLLVATTRLLAVEQQAESSPEKPVEATSARDDTVMQVTREQQSVILNIRCTSGIGQATLRRTKEAWLKEVVVRLHLKGLESLKATSGNLAIEWSVSSHEEASQRSTIVSAGNTRELKPTDPEYAEVRIVGGDRTIPLDEGYFELTLPQRLFKENPGSIDLSWIDFYRQ